jgi:hypothetical protein
MDKVKQEHINKIREEFEKEYDKLHFLVVKDAYENAFLYEKLYKQHKQIEELKELIELKNKLLIKYRIGSPSGKGVGQIIDKTNKLENKLKEVLK